MRQRRIKIDPADGEAVYHCVSRTVNGEFLFSERDREQLRWQIWAVADYLGMEVLTYTILSNHFHVLVRAPRKIPLPDSELLRRYERMYPRPTMYQTSRLEVIKAQLTSGGLEVEQWRQRQLRLMGDVSAYLKLVKQRFSIGFNKEHKRFGTLWSERFKSVLVEQGAALLTIAAYIDLNCVRAGLAIDPKDYRFCGYAEGVAGKEAARAGIALLYGETWSVASAQYRLLLFGTGSDPLSSNAAISEQAFQKVLREKGELTAFESIRCRIRFFSDSGIIGSKMFIEEAARHCGLERFRPPRVVSAIYELKNLYKFRGSRRRALQ